ncbi:unnamed protein product, partial [Prorocentrum cordatum]
MRVLASKPNLPRHPKLDTSAQWISQWMFEARRAASLSTARSRLDGLRSPRGPSSRLPPNADGDMADLRRTHTCKALALIGSVFDALDAPSAGCLAEIVGATPQKHIEHAVGLARQRFGNWIDQQDALCGKGLHALTREPMPRHLRPLAADAPDGEGGPPLPVPADQQTCAELLVKGRLLGPGRCRHVAAGIFKQGVEASFAYGVCCTGPGDSDLDAARAMAFRSVEIRPSGKSRTAALATSSMGDDPVFKATRDPVRTLRRAVWERWLPRQALDKAFAAALAASGSWAHCC